MRLRDQIRKIILESMQERKKILILVHPEGLIETNSDVFPLYVDRIKEDILKFDKVFAYSYLPEGFLNSLISTKGEIVRDSFEQLKYVLSTGNSSFKKDTNMLKTAFETEIGDYLVLNENVDIYIAGGNQDLCLRSSCGNLLRILKDEISEFDHSVKIYIPLVYHRQRNSGTEDYIPGNFGKTIYPASKSVDFDFEKEKESGGWFERFK